jgi:heme oxygenase
MSMMTPPPPPPITPIEKIEMTRIDAENKRKQADLELQMKKLQSDNASNVLEFETKVKELELKYNTQLDAAKIKADADINKIIVSNASKAFNAAQQSTEQLEQEIGKANADGKEQVTKGSK